MNRMFMISRPRNIPDVPREIVEAATANFLKKGGVIKQLPPSPVFEVNWKTIQAGAFTSLDAFDNIPLSELGDDSYGV